MRVAVLGSPDSWYFRDLARAAAKHDQIVPAPFSQIRSKTIDGQTDVFSGDLRLNSFDAVLVRTMPPGSLEQVVYRMDCLARLEAEGTLVVNGPKAIETAVDKFLASAKLAAAGLPHPPVVACQTWQDALDAFGDLGGDVVVKPLFGSEGRGIVRVCDEQTALRVFKAIALIGAVIYLQPYIDHEGFDIRIFLAGEKTLAMRRRSAGDWRTNVSCGASAEAIEPTDAMLDLARRASIAVGTTIAGVDLLADRSGAFYVIEVNAVPGWQALAKSHNADVAAIVLGELRRMLDGRTAQ